MRSLSQISCEFIESISWTNWKYFLNQNDGGLGRNNRLIDLFRGKLEASPVIKSPFVRLWSWSTLRSACWVLDNVAAFRLICRCILFPCLFTHLFVFSLFVFFVYSFSVCFVCFCLFVCLFACLLACLLVCLFVCCCFFCLFVSFCVCLFVWFFLLVCGYSVGQFPPKGGRALTLTATEEGQSECGLFWIQTTEWVHTH